MNSGYDEIKGQWMNQWDVGYSFLVQTFLKEGRIRARERMLTVVFIKLSINCSYLLVAVFKELVFKKLQIVK